MLGILHRVQSPGVTYPAEKWLSHNTDSYRETFCKDFEAKTAPPDSFSLKLKNEASEISSSYIVRPHYELCFTVCAALSSSQSVSFVYANPLRHILRNPVTTCPPVLALSPLCCIFVNIPEEKVVVLILFNLQASRLNVKP